MQSKTHEETNTIGMFETAKKMKLSSVSADCIHSRTHIHRRNFILEEPYITQTTLVRI